MFVLAIAALLVTTISFGFPPLFPLAFALWAFMIMRIRRNYSEICAEEQAKVDAEQARFDAAQLRYFRSGRE